MSTDDLPMKIRYEFFMIGSQGEGYPWGYRKDRDAAIKRLKELREYAERRDTLTSVECIKVLTRETRHPHDLDD
jgi:hypothetical protein